MTTYDGHVAQDGPWADRRDGRLFIRKVSVGPMDNNVYVLADAATRDAYLVDAAANPARLREALDGFDPIAVLQTHGHQDHTRAWAALASDPGLPVWGHPGDADLFPAPLDRELQGGESLPLGELTVEVLHTPGHTDGAIQFLVRGDKRLHLISGDSLFPGGPGNTWGDSARFAQLMSHLQDQVFGALPDETWIYPGHGDDTTVGAERPSVPDWLARGW